MKKLIVTVVLAFVLGSPLCGEDETLLTDGAPNGRYWKSLRANDRIHLLVGFYQGLTMGVLVVGNDLERVNTFIARYWPGLTYGETSDAIDIFYTTPENGPLTLAEALGFVAMKAHGVTARTIEERTESVRRIRSESAARHAAPKTVEFDPAELTTVPPEPK